MCKNCKNKEIYDSSITPYDSCLFCSKKHLAYSMALFNKNYERSIVQVYLAYKHLENNYNESAIYYFNILKKMLDKQITFEQLKQTLNYYNQVENKDNPLNLQATLSKKNLLFLYSYSAFQLYYYQVGYQAINQPYVIGYLQLATEHTENESLKEKIRVIWKQIQNNEDCRANFEDVLETITDDTRK